MRGIFLLGYGKPGIRHAEGGVFADSAPSQPPGRRPQRGQKTGRRGWVALPAAKPATLRGSHRTLFSWGVAPTSGAWRRFSNRCRDEAAQIEEKRGRDDYPVRVARDGRRASARAVTGSDRNPARVVRLQPAGLSGQAEVDNDGKPGVSGTPQTGSCNFSRASLLESGEPDDMVRQCGSKAGLPDFGERLGGKAVNSHWADQSQDRQDPRRRLGKARDHRRREDRQR